MIENPNPEQSKSQNQRILEYLKTGKTLTPLQALQLFNCWALSSRIAELNKILRDEGNGAKIECKLIKGEDGKKFGEYSYVIPEPIYNVPGSVQIGKNGVLFCELPLNELK